MCDRALVVFILLQENDRELEQKGVKEYQDETDKHLFICLHSFTKDIQQSKREVYLKEVGWCWRGEGYAYSNLFRPGGHRTARQPV